MLLPQQKLLAAILISSLFTAGCLNNTVKQFGKLRRIQAELTDRFGDEISLHVSDGKSIGTLTVAYINSRLNYRSQTERSKRAEETAKIVYAHYANSTLLTSVFVIFLRRETEFFVFHQSYTVDEYGYEREGQQIRLAAAYLPSPPPDSEITAGYAATEGKTDISTASTLQLDGEPGGYGMTVMPHFRLVGDASRRRALPPEEVSFYVASYSKKPRFSEPVPVEFIADGSPVMQGTATFTGNDAQYCSIKVSYSAFRKMATAKEVAIKLGAKEYPLTPEQIQLLSKMDAYVLE